MCCVVTDGENVTREGTQQAGSDDDEDLGNVSDTPVS